MGTIISIRRSTYPSRKSVDTLPEAQFDEECVICLDNRGATVLTPCLHKNICLRCIHLLIKHQGFGLTCPSCRAKVQEIYAYAPQMIYDLKN